VCKKNRINQITKYRGIYQLTNTRCKLNYKKEEWTTWWPLGVNVILKKWNEPPSGHHMEIYKKVKKVNDYYIFD
jgi:hypothetical protein